MTRQSTDDCRLGYRSTQCTIDGRCSNPAINLNRWKGDNSRRLCFRSRRFGCTCVRPEFGSAYFLRRSGCRLVGANGINVAITYWTHFFVERSLKVLRRRSPPQLSGRPGRSKNPSHRALGMLGGNICLLIRWSRGFSCSIVIEREKLFCVHWTLTIQLHYWNVAQFR
jgi:hypothetical protein